MDIQEILTRKEDQTFDCKSIQIGPKALAVPIVAFANADGGVIAIGVSDKTRKIEGVTNMRKNSTNCFECHSISVIRQYLSHIPICPAPTKMESKTESF